MRFEKQIFTTEVTLDHNEFVDCEFQNCAVVFFGGQFKLERTKFTNVRFGLSGAANETLQYLKFVRSMSPAIFDELINAPATHFQPEAPKPS